VLCGHGEGVLQIRMSARFGAKKLRIFRPRGVGINPVQTFFGQGCLFSGDICVFIVL